MPPARGRRRTRIPAAISTSPTSRMKVRPSTGSLRSTSGLRYCSQSVSRLVNLSAPATMGTNPYPSRIIDFASDRIAHPRTPSLGLGGRRGSPRPPGARGRRRRRRACKRGRRSPAPLLPLPVLPTGINRAKAATRRFAHMLQVGDVAPDFELLDEEGKPTRLSSFRGRTVVLVFFPAAFSPVCTQELKEMAANRADYDRQGAVVVGV